MVSTKTRTPRKVPQDVRVLCPCEAAVSRRTLAVLTTECPDEQNPTSRRSCRKGRRSGASGDSHRSARSPLFGQREPGKSRRPGGTVSSLEAPDRYLAGDAGPLQRPGHVSAHRGRRYTASAATWGARLRAGHPGSGTAAYGAAAGVPTLRGGLSGVRLEQATQSLPWARAIVPTGTEWCPEPPGVSQRLGARYPLGQSQSSEAFSLKGFPSHMPSGRKSQRVGAEFVCRHEHNHTVFINHRRPHVTTT